MIQKRGKGRAKKHTPSPEERVYHALLTLLESMQIDHVGDGYDIGYNQALYDIAKRLRNDHGNQRVGANEGSADDGESTQLD